MNAIIHYQPIEQGYLAAVRTLLVTLLFWVATTFALSATDVPRGGISVPAGVGGTTVTLTNKTGEAAEDITIQLVSNGGANITKVNISKTTADKIDDNGNGSLDNGEGDTNLDPPSQRARTILSGTNLPANNTITINIDYDTPLPPNSTLNIWLSNKDDEDGTHRDMCSIAPINGFGTTVVNIPSGVAQANLGLANHTFTYVSNINLFLPPTALNSIYLDPPYEQSIVTLTPNGATIQLMPPLAPFSLALYNVILSDPVSAPGGLPLQIANTSPQQGTWKDGLLNTSSGNAMLNLNNLGYLMMTHPGGNITGTNTLTLDPIIDDPLLPQSVMVGIEPIAPQIFGPGSDPFSHFFTWAATGTSIPAAITMPLGSVTCSADGIGQAFILNANFSPIGALGTRLEIWQNGNFVHAINGFQGSNIGQLTAPFIEVRLGYNAATQQTTWTCQTAGPAPIFINDNGMYMGDELRFIPEITFPLSQLNALSFSSAGLLQEVFMSQTVQYNALPDIAGSLNVLSVVANTCDSEPSTHSALVTVAAAGMPKSSEYQIVNNTGQAASDFHAIFAGTGGTLKTELTESPAGCGAATITDNLNRVDIVWSAACVPNGSSIKIKVCSEHGAPAFAGGYWTLNGQNIGAIAANDISSIAFNAPNSTMSFGGGGGLPIALSNETATYFFESIAGNAPLSSVQVGLIPFFEPFFGIAPANAPYSIPTCNSNIETVTPTFAHLGDVIDVYGTQLGLQTGNAAILLTANTGETIPINLIAQWTPEHIQFILPCDFPQTVGQSFQVVITTNNGNILSTEPIHIDAPTACFFVTPSAGSFVAGENVQLKVEIDAITPYIDHAFFEYRPVGSAVWLSLGVDNDGSDIQANTTGATGSGDGWSVYWNTDLISADAVEIRATLVSTCGMSYISTQTLYLSDTPAPQINLVNAVLRANRLVNGDSIRVPFSLIADVAQVNINVTDIGWHWQRVLEHIDQNAAQTSLDSVACGPYAAASCLKYMGIEGDIAAIKDSLMKHAGTNASGTSEGALMRAIKKVLKDKLGAGAGGWTVTHKAGTEVPGLIKDLVENKDVILLLGGDSSNHFVTLSSYGTHKDGSQYIDFMDPAGGVTDTAGIDNNGNITGYEGLGGNVKVLGGIIVTKPAGSGSQRPTQEQAALRNGNLIPTITIPTPGGGNYEWVIAATEFELGNSIITFSGEDNNGHEQHQTIIVTINGCNDLTWEATYLDMPLQVLFNDHTSYDGAHPPIAWEWDFDNNGTIDANIANPIYSFATAGTYTVTMYVETAECRDAISQTIQVSATPAPRYYINALLQGAYIGNGTMQSTLNEYNLLPTAQPYNQSPWNYNGTETVNNMRDDVTDWVLIELHATTNLYTVITQRAALLHRNGTISDIDGLNGVAFAGLNTAQNYHIVIRHRNHLAVMSSIPVAPNNTTSYDFTNSINQALGSNQMTVLSDNKIALLAGDANADGVISVADFNVLQTQIAQINQYLSADFNLNRTATTADFNLLQSNASQIGITYIRLP